MAYSTILCIDDEPEIPKIWKQRLEPYGVRFLIAANGARQGYAAAVQEIPDLILVDLMMPIEDGKQVLQRLRSDPRTQNVPVVMLTGSDPSSLKRSLAALGVAACLTKPIVFAELLEIIRRQVSLSLNGDRPSEKAPKSPNSADCFLKPRTVR